MKSFILKMRLILLFSTSFRLLTACGPAAREDLPTSVKAFPSLIDAWAAKQIPVCWETSAHGFHSERDWVKTAIEREFHTKTSVRFVGWNYCDDRSRGIRISASDEVPHVKGLGKKIDGIVNGMVLNFSFQRWSSTCSVSESAKRRCIETISVHEFGHAIGLAHEQNRGDTPRDLCKDAPQGSDGDTIVGSWDLESVMNYCNPTWSGGGVLSRGDVLGIRYLYDGMMRFEIQTPTRFHAGPLEAHYKLADFDLDGFADLYGIYQSATGSKSTEVHILSGKGLYNEFILQTATALHETNRNYDFALGFSDGDSIPDLFVLAHSGSQGNPEIHVLSGGSRYREFIVHKSLGNSLSNCVVQDFDVADYDGNIKQDLYFFKTCPNDGGVNRIQVLSGEDMSRELVNRKTLQGGTPEDMAWSAMSWDDDAHADVVRIDRRATGSGNTEVHVYSGASEFQSPLYRRTTMLEEVGANFQFDVTRLRNQAKPSVVAIKTWSTGTSMVEIHSLFYRD